MECNGKFYPLWGQFVEKKAEWIGGTVISEGCETVIVDIKLEPNGDDSAMFCVCGKDFDAAGDVQMIGISGGHSDDCLNISAPYGMSFRMMKP